VPGSVGGFLAVLHAQLGILYVLGGSSPDVGFDCSGIEQYSAGRQGVALSRTTEEMWADAKAGRNNLKAIWVSPDPFAVQNIGQALAKALPGDLLEFNVPSDSQSQPAHTGVYLGNGQMIQAPETFVAPGVRGRVEISQVPNDVDIFLMGVARITAFDPAPPSPLPTPPLPEGEEDMALTAFEGSDGTIHCFGVASSVKVGLGHLLHFRAAGGQPPGKENWGVDDATQNGLTRFPDAGPYTVEP
jgi:hypothetical protein